jgi:hypothetical protein
VSVKTVIIWWLMFVIMLLGASLPKLHKPVFFAMFFKDLPFWMELVRVCLDFSLWMVPAHRYVAMGRSLSFLAMTAIRLMETVARQTAVFKIDTSAIMDQLKLPLFAHLHILPNYWSSTHKRLINRVYRIGLLCSLP